MNMNKDHFLEQIAQNIPEYILKTLLTLDAVWRLKMIRQTRQAIQSDLMQ